MTIAVSARANAVVMMALAVAVLERGREAGIEMTERYVLTPLGSAAIVGLVVLAALIVIGYRRGPAA